MVQEIGLSFLAGILNFSASHHVVSGYTVAQGNCRERDTAKVYRVFRSFSLDHVPTELGVDVDTPWNPGFWIRTRSSAIHRNS